MLCILCGCKVNQYETNAMIQQFQTKGYEIVDFNESADIYIINTCTVTNISDKKSRQILRRAKEKSPNSIVVAVGCYVQVAKKEIEEIPEIDFALGTNEKVHIVEYIEEFLKDRNLNFEIEDISKHVGYEDFGSITYTEKTRAVIKIQDGCDRFCTYCIIPFARGRVRSRAPVSIIKEIENIVKNGVKEVVITGIHIASYGKEFENGYRLIDLLEDINKIGGVKRIRLGSIEPNLITNQFIKRLKKLDKICEHFHLSLQSGCTETLKRMNRVYTAEEFEIIVDRIRKEYKEVILTTDIIVGFPGETEEEFKQTYEFLKKINFYKMHVFKYSQRKGTKAALMENQVSSSIKESRSKTLIALSDKNEEKYQKKCIGKNLKVLFEEFDGEFYKGHTSNYIIVKSKSNFDICNEIKEVYIEESNNLELNGKIM